MARPGVGVERILEAIKDLEAAGREPTATAVRERLGSGSYSTIAAVLTDWRRDKAQARPAVPEPPESVKNLSSQLWTAAWAAAMSVHEPERQAFATDRQEFERQKTEMHSEIARLEAELDAEKERAARTIQNLTIERDRFQTESEKLRTALATAEGALAEARTQLEREQGRNRELSDRVIAEAAKVESLTAKLKESSKRPAERHRR